ncbi:MAG: diguanylate cyclase [bacterium]
MNQYTSQDILLKTNKKLTQKVFALHNIFRISLDLTSILDREKLIYTYIVNIIGLLRVNGAVLLLPDSHDNSILRIVAQKGFRLFHKHFSLPISSFEISPKSETYNVAEIDSSQACDFLQVQHERAQKAGVRLVAPLFHLNSVQGVVLIGEKVNHEPPTTSDFELLTLVNNFFATVLINVDLVERLEMQSSTDSLTQLANRRAFENYLQKEIARAERSNLEFSIVMIDIDHFKHYNDRNGHIAGDKLLRQFADVLRKSVRTSDIAARYGGEEFVIILVGVDSQGATAFCHRLRETILHHSFPFGENQTMGFVSASIGLSSFPKHGRDAVTIVAQADEALYNAKASGRNKVCVYPPKLHSGAEAASTK